jgi:ferritin-like metal-binding protein YciE
MAPAAVQPGHIEEERTVQNLIVAFAIENAEVAMYEALRISAGMAGDTMTASMVERMQTQEQLAAERIWNLIAMAAERAVAFRRKDGGSLKEVVIRYLQNAESVARNVEDALAGFSKVGDQKDVQTLLATISSKAKSQHLRLQARLEALGGARSVAPSFLAHMLAFGPLTTQLGHDDSEKGTQHLMIVYAAAAAEMAMYEALQMAVEAAGDSETLKLAQQLQLEESEDHRLAWEKLPEAARTSSRAVLSTV